MHCKVSIVFGTVDRTECVKNLMDTIVQYTPPVDYEVIIVDGSEKGSAWSLACKYPRTVYFAESRSAGFARACNDGVRVASGNYLVWLNDDCLVTPGWLERTIQFMVSHPQVGVGGLCFDEGSRTGIKQQIYNCYYANFGCVPTALWRALGGFDERFHFYGADTDLSFRVMARGYVVMPVPGVCITHLRVQDSLSHEMSKERHNSVRLFKHIWAGKSRSLRGWVR